MFFLRAISSNRNPHIFVGMVFSAKQKILEVCETIFNYYWNWSGERDINPFQKSTEVTGS